MFPLYCEAPTSPGLPAPFVKPKSPVDLRLVEWLMGRLRFRWRCLISSQQEQCILLSKVIQAHGSSPCAQAAFPWGPSLSPLLDHWTAGLIPTLTFTSRDGPCFTCVLVSKVWKPLVKLSGALLQPLPPVLLGYPEPSSVLSGYKWSLKVPIFG